MLDAIVYCSKCGHTKAYAEAVADNLHLPIYSLNEANDSLNTNAKILYFGWVRENIIQGYDRLSNFYVEAVVAVGIYLYSIEMMNHLRNENQLFFDVFYLRGGIDKSKLSFKDKWVLKSIERHLAFKRRDSSLTIEEAVIYDILHQEKDVTNLDAIAPIIAKYKEADKMDGFIS